MVCFLICWFGLSQPTDYKGLEKDAMSKSPNRKALNSPIHSLSAPRKPTFCWRISMSHLAQQLASSEVLPRWTFEVHVGNISGDTDHKEIGELKYQKEPQICSIQWVNLDHQWEPLESLEMMNYHDDVEIPLVTYSTHKLIWRFPKSWGYPMFHSFW